MQALSWAAAHCFRVHWSFRTCTVQLIQIAELFLFSDVLCLPIVLGLTFGNGETIVLKVLNDGSLVAGTSPEDLLQNPVTLSLQA